MPSLQPDIANQTVRLAMAWGEFLDQPTNGRLTKLHPALSPEELDHYDRVATEALKFAIATVYAQAAVLGLTNPVLKGVCEQIVIGRYPWMSGDTFGSVFAQGQSYVGRDGLG